MEMYGQFESTMDKIEYLAPTPPCLIGKHKR